MNDVESFAELTKQLLAALEGLVKAVPAWRGVLGDLSDLTPGTMRYHGIEGSSGAFWDQVAADLELLRLEAARVALVDALSEPMDRLPGPTQLDE